MKLDPVLKKQEEWGEALTQCDQIWRHFAILATKIQSLAILRGFYFDFGKILNLLRQIVMLLGKYSLL